MGSGKNCVSDLASNDAGDFSPPAIVRRLIDAVFNDGDLTALNAAFLPVDHDGVTEGLDASRLRGYVAAIRAAAPDARWTVVEQVSEGTTVVTRLSVRGTFSGPLFGLAPPGRTATVTAVVLSRLTDGYLSGLWVQADLLGLLEQLGVLPALELTQAVAMANVARFGTALAADIVPRSPPDGESPAP